MKLNKFRIVLAVGLISSLLAGCGTNASTAGQPANSGAQAKGGTLRIAISNDVDGLDPQRTVSASTFEVTNNIYDTLVGTDPKGNLLPRLATEWNVSSDKKSWTFKLRDDVSFQNGRKFTADDVKFSMERLLEKQSPRASDYAMIDNIKVDSPTQITFNLKQPNAPFISSLAMPWAAIVPQEAVTQLKTHPMGTGAFKLKEWVPQQKVVLEKNPSYFLKNEPYLDGVEFQVIPDMATQLVNLKSGQIDVATISGEQAAEVKQSSNLTLYSKPSNSVQVLAMNNKVTPLNDVRVRQAIAMAINKDAVIQGSNWGFGETIGSHMSPLDPYYVDLNKVLSYDSAKAKQLLQEAGYGQGFDLTLSLPQPYAIHRKAGEVVADQLKQIGIRVKLETVDWGKWLKDIYAGRNYQMTIIAHTGRLDPDAMLNRYASNSKENYMNYSNPTVDAALKQGILATDMAARKKIYTTVEETLAKEVPAVFLQAPNTLLALNKKVQGFDSFPIDIYELKSVTLTR
ncbi:MAG: ABC transporter substrate-binding protein [Desulfitobacteriaceae bacterium]